MNLYILAFLTFNFNGDTKDLHINLIELDINLVIFLKKSHN